MVWWFSEWEWQDNYQSLTRALGHNAPAGEGVAMVSSLHGCIPPQWQCLFVYDGLGPLHELTRLLTALPNAQSQSFLFVSRETVWPLSLPAPIVVSPYSSLEARAFVFRMLPSCPPRDVDALVLALDNHPFALSLACAYLTRTRSRIAPYVAAYSNCHRLRCIHNSPAIPSDDRHTRLAVPSSHYHPNPTAPSEHQQLPNDDAQTANDDVQTANDDVQTTHDGVQTSIILLSDNESTIVHNYQYRTVDEAIEGAVFDASQSLRATRDGLPKIAILLFFLCSYYFHRFICICIFSYGV